MLDACERLVDDLVRDRRGHRLKAGSYVFDPDFTRDVIIKWEGDTDVVHGVEPCAHLSPALDRWAHDPRFLEPMCDFVGSDAPILFTEKLNLKRPQRGGVNPLHQDYPYWVGRRAGPDAGRDVDAVPRRRARRQRLPPRRARQPYLGRVADAHRRRRVRRQRDRRRAYEDVESVPLELPAGSVVMFGPYLVHHSHPNTSSQPRRALLFSYQPPGAPHMLVSLRRLGARVPLPVTDTILRPVDDDRRRRARAARVAGNRVTHAQRDGSGVARTRPTRPRGGRPAGLPAVRAGARAPPPGEPGVGCDRRRHRQPVLHCGRPRHRGRRTRRRPPLGALQLRRGRRHGVVLRRHRRRRAHGGRRDRGRITGRVRSSAAARPRHSGRRRRPSTHARRTWTPSSSTIVSAPKPRPRTCSRTDRRASPASPARNGSTPRTSGCRDIATRTRSPACRSTARSSAAPTSSSKAVIAPLARCSSRHRRRTRCSSRTSP